MKEILNYTNWCREHNLKACDSNVLHFYFTQKGGAVNDRY